jgi:hypothetical protein
MFKKLVCKCGKEKIIGKPLDDEVPEIVESRCPQCFDPPKTTKDELIEKKVVRC